MNPFSPGIRVTISGHPSVYVVREAQAVDGGCWRLGLRPGVAPFDLLWVDVFQSRAGVWLTEGLEELKVEGAPIVERDMPEGYTACRSCGAPIRFSYSKQGRKTPVNPNGTSHFSTCPQSEQWRKQQEAKPASPRVGEPGAAPDDAGQLSLL